MWNLTRYLCGDLEVGFSQWGYYSMGIPNGDFVRGFSMGIISRDLKGEFKWDIYYGDFVGEFVLGLFCMGTIN